MDAELTNFLVYARAATYASGKKPELEIGKRFFIKKSEFSYLDVFYDQLQVFQGQEVIFKNEKPVWSFSYRGTVETPQKASEVFFFLRKCLIELRFTARLHHFCNFSFQEWDYRCSGTGGFEEFSGKETIDCEGIRLYLMSYFGGIII